MKYKEQLNPDKRPIQPGEANMYRHQCEDLPVIIDGVEWDADERSLFRLEALGAMATKNRRGAQLRSGTNAVVEMDQDTLAQLPGRIRAALGERFERLHAEYNAIKAEIEGGARITAEEARRRLAAKV